MVNEKVLGLTSLCLVTLMLLSILSVLHIANSPVVQEELDLTVSGSNECLRFLTRDVGVVYVPFSVGVSENWDLVVECTKIATPRGWVDLYLYEGYWDEGVNHKCVSEDIYPILDSIESLDFELSLDNPFVGTFVGSGQSYTLFFIFPPGGPSSFHISLNRSVGFLPMIKSG